MTSTYVRTAARLGPLVHAVGLLLSSLPDSSRVSTEELAAADSSRLATTEEAIAVASAFSDLGVLVADRGVYVLDTVALRGTDQYRRGVREAFSAIFAEPGSTSDRLCVAVPPHINDKAAERLRSLAVDLRSAVVDVIASANSRLLMTSPFWDSQTLCDLSPLLMRRMDAGVEVIALGRFRQHEISALGNVLTTLVRHPRFRAVSWFHSDVEHITTFHFKAVVADGRKAYLGSANLTTGGLRSRMELGIILHGEMASSLAAVIDAILPIGMPLSCGGAV